MEERKENKTVRIVEAVKVFAREGGGVYNFVSGEHGKKFLIKEGG